VPLENDYQAVLTAFHPFDDLVRRFMRDSHCALTMPDVLQPQAPDADLNAFKAADAATKWMDKKAQSVVAGSKILVPIVVGGVGLAVGAVLLARRAVERAVLRTVEPDERQGRGS